MQIADFKNRNKFSWGFISILMNLPSFILISFLPSLKTKNEKEEYNRKITLKYDLIGYCSAIILFIILAGLYYFSAKPKFAITFNVWFHIIFIFLIMTSSVVLASFLLSFIRLIKNTEFPKAVLLFYKLFVIFYPLSIVAGAIYAKHMWGRFWSWDLKEISSLLIYYIGIMICTYFLIRVPNKTTQFLLSVLHIGIFLFLSIFLPELLI